MDVARRLAPMACNVLQMLERRRAENSKQGFMRQRDYVKSVLASYAE
jgi:hypothetical protein